MITKKCFKGVLLLILIALSVPMTTYCKYKDFEWEAINLIEEGEKNLEIKRESQNNNDNQHSYENIKEEPIKDPIEEIKDIVRNIIEKQKDAIVGNNRITYINTLNPNDNILQNDKGLWSYCLSQGEIQSFALEIVEFLLVEEEKVVVLLHLKYTIDENHYDLTYPAKFVKIQKKWYYSGPNYKEISRDNVRLLYFEQDQEHSERVMKIAVESYEKVLSNLGLEESIDIAIKFYSDKDWLRQFVYPNSNTYFTGYATGGGNLNLTYNELKSEDDMERSLKSTLIHEITHEISFEIANNQSMPRWLFEGLAEYYAGPPISTKEYGELRVWTLEELDTCKFYELTDSAEIRSFYVTGAQIVGYLVDKYGEKEIVQLYQEIGENSLPRSKFMENFIAAFEKTFGITYDDFKEEWKEYKNIN